MIRVRKLHTEVLKGFSHIIQDGQSVKYLEQQS